MLVLVEARRVRVLKVCQADPQVTEREPWGQSCQDASAEGINVFLKVLQDDEDEARSERA